MKHIITTVGTSVYTNFAFGRKVKEAYKEPTHENIFNYDSIEPLENKKANEYTKSDFSGFEDALKKYWLIGIKKREDDKKKWHKWKDDTSVINLDASAEIKSICKIIEESKDTEFKIYLICSDTAICMSAGHLIKAFFEEINPELRNSNGDKVTVCFSQYSPVQVDELIIDNANSFIETAIYNLISRLDKVKDQKDVTKNDIILNISGGYKALIPIITIYAQIRENDIAYVYEDSNELITITPFPLKFDTEVYFSDGLLIRQDFLDTIKNQLGDNQPNSEQKDIFQKLVERQRNRKLLYNDKIKRTTLGVVLRSLSATDIENDFGDKIIEPALKDFFNDANRSIYQEYSNAQIKIRIDKNLSVENCPDVFISEIDLEMLKNTDTKVIGEIKALIANNDYIKKVNTCEDYFYKMKGRILLHNDFENFKDKPIEFLYIVYAFQFDVSRNSFKGNQSVEHFRKRFSEDEDLKKLEVTFRALGLTIPIEKPLEFNYEEFKKDWTKYLYEPKNWEEL